MSAIEKNHDYHMVEPSPWPFVISIAVFVMMIGAIAWMQEWTPWLFFIGLAGVLYTFYAWWSDVRGLASTTTIADAFTQPGRNGSVSLTYRF